MLRLLYRLFRKHFNKFCFEEQSKPIGFESLSFQFVDSEGTCYYAFDDMLDIPMERQYQLMVAQQEYSARISQEEFTRDLEAIEKALNGGVSPDLAKIGWIISEWKWRREYILPFNVILDMVACFYVSEKENPNKFDHEEHDRKIKQFEKDYDSGLRVFFCNEELMRLTGLINISQERLDELIQNSRARMEASGKVIRNYLSEKESSSRKKNERKNY